VKGTLFLIHWKASEAEALATPLRTEGWQVDIEAEDGARAGRAIKANQPDAVVIYLTRLPSHGRETADGLRSIKATRDIPIVFVDGNEEAIEKTRARVPSALYTTSGDLPKVLGQLTGTNGSAPATNGVADEPVPPPETGFRKISEEAVMARTGKGWQEWLAILDAWGAPTQGHTRTAAYLLDHHGLSGWWAQAVAIRYEWERGLRR